MFKKILNIALGSTGKKSIPRNSSGEPHQKRPLSINYDNNLKLFREAFNLCDDVVFRKFKLDLAQPLRACVIYIAPLTDHTMLTNDLIEPLTKGFRTHQEIFPGNPNNLQKIICENILISAEISTSSDLLELEKNLLQGNSILMLEGTDSAVIVGTHGGEVRSVDEPSNEPVVRGPKDGFVENLDTNVSLIRRRIKTSRLKCRTFQLGQLTVTKIAVCYIQGIANDKVVAEVVRRINRINTAGILASNYIDELITDEPISIFPLVQYTERPDKTASSLLEGRVCVIVDNTPMVLILPLTFISLMQASDDYYNNWIFASFIRLLRFVALNIALLFPAATIAMFAFHQDMVPDVLLSTAAAARQNVPFPIFFELLLMELTFELLQEAGVRLPKTIGQAISTVGGLVIGQAAVNAGFVSPISVIVVAITAIATFTTPNYAAAATIRLLRFFLIVLAGLLGGYGIILGLMAILGHLCALRSFGVPYLAPIAPLIPRDLKDTMVRVPLWGMVTRPGFLRTKKKVAQAPDQGPAKPDEGGDGE